MPHTARTLLSTEQFEKYVAIDYSIPCSRVLANNEICKKMLEANRVSIDIESSASETEAENYGKSNTPRPLEALSMVH